MILFSVGGFLETSNHCKKHDKYTRHRAGFFVCLLYASEHQRKQISTGVWVAVYNCVMQWEKVVYNVLVVGDSGIL